MRPRNYRHPDPSFHVSKSYWLDFQQKLALTYTLAFSLLSPPLPTPKKNQSISWFSQADQGEWDFQEREPYETDETSISRLNF